MSLHPSAMVERLGWLTGRLCRWLTAHVHLDRREVEQVRELVRYLDRAPEPATIARILNCSERLVQAYLALIPEESG